MRIYHVVMPDKWNAFKGSSYEHDSLEAEGFIHCSFEEQLDEVLKRYFSGVDAVTVLEIDPARLTSRLVVEPSTNGESYPHIYGPINTDSIVGTKVRQLT
jgi:uncharacterized protein (DUF952 family)